MWIDACCINQSDENERNAQVTRMADIYSQASQVTVYLGQSEVGSELAIDALKHISNGIELCKDGIISRSPGTDTGFHRPDLQLPISNEIWEAVRHLVNRQWFTRLWVIQEVLLGDTRAKMVCGQSEISWTRFCTAVVTIHRNDFIPDDLRRDIAPVDTLCLCRPLRDAVKFTSLLGALRLCSEPRDAVYGFLGLLPEGLGRRIHPNYKAPLVEVHTSSTLAYINHTKRLDVLDISAHGNQKSDFPSWVFDPSGLRNGGTTYLTLQWPGQFCAHFSECHVTYKAPGILGVLGLGITRVLSVKPRVPGIFECGSDEHRVRSCIQTVRSWEPDDLYDRTYATGESFLEAYARTLICNDLRDRTPSWGRYTPERWQGQYWINPLFGELAQEGHVTASGLTRQEKDPLDLLTGRRFMTCENGLIGIGPADARPGEFAITDFVADQPKSK